MHKNPINHILISGGIVSGIYKGMTAFSIRLTLESKGFVGTAVKKWFR